MRQDLAGRFLKAIGTVPTTHTAKWQTARCPLAPWRHTHGDRTPSFGVALTRGQWGKCLGCGFSGSLFELVQLIARLNRQQPSGKPFNYQAACAVLEMADEDESLLPDEPPFDEKVFNQPLEIHPFPQALLDALEPAWFETHTHPYLQARGVTAETARALDIRYDSHQGRIVFPLRDFYGRFVGLHGRSVLPEPDLKYLFYTHEKHSNPMVWHGEDRVTFDQPVLVAESVFDMAAVYPHYQNVVTPRFASLPAKMVQRLDGADSFITLFDHDKAGDIARLMVENTASCPVLHLDPDPYKDAGEMPEEALGKLVKLGLNSLHKTLLKA